MDKEFEPQGKALQEKQGKQKKQRKQSKVKSLDETLQQITAQPKRKHTQEEIDEARENLTLMNDRVFLYMFMENKNNHLVKGTTDAVRKIYALAPIPPVQSTVVQNLTLLDVLGRGMIADMLAYIESIILAFEVQQGKQVTYAVRGTLTSSNAMRTGLNKGDDFADAPDVIGLNILGFRLPQLEHRKEFVSRIVRVEYDSKEYFLADKYSDFYIELPKMDDWKKEDLPEVYHDLWDICCVLRTKAKDMEEVIRMQAIKNPVALELADEFKKTVARNDVVNETLDRYDELLELDYFFRRREQKVAEQLAKKLTEQAARDAEKAAEKAARDAEKAAEKAARDVEKAAKSADMKAKEQMLVLAIKSNAPPEVVAALQQGAGITDKHLARLKKQAQKK